MRLRFFKETTINANFFPSSFSLGAHLIVSISKCMTIDDKSLPPRSIAMAGWIVKCRMQILRFYNNYYTIRDNVWITMFFFSCVCVVLFFYVRFWKVLVSLARSSGRYWYSIFVKCSFLFDLILFHTFQLPLSIPNYQTQPHMRLHTIKSSWTLSNLINYPAIQLCLWF